MLRSLLDVVPTGSIVMYASTTAPDRWLLCDGNDYPSLYNIIGNTFGGGNGKFRVPDLSGMFVRGISNGRSIGDIQDEQFPKHSHTATLDAAGSHTHDFKKSTIETTSEGSHTHDLKGGWGGDSDFTGYAQFLENRQEQSKVSPGDFATKRAGEHKHECMIPDMKDAGSHSHSIKIDQTGGDELRPKNIAFQYMIKI